MKISYPMICQVCSRNDVLTETSGYAAAVAQTGRDVNSLHDLASKGTWRWFTANIDVGHLRNRPYSKQVIQEMRGSVSIPEHDLYQFYTMLWVDGFVNGIARESKKNGGPFSAEHSLDPEATVEASQQRSMRMFTHDYRGHVITSGRFQTSERPVTPTKKELFLSLESLWSDGFIAGTMCERKRRVAEGGGS